MNDTRINDVTVRIEGTLQDAVTWLKAQGVELADFVIVEHFKRAPFPVAAYQFMANTTDKFYGVARNIATFIPNIQTLQMQPGPAGMGRLYPLGGERESISWMLESELV